MFKSTDGRFFDDVLAEFDSVFPAVNVATKNPTTSRKIGDGGDTILLPGNLNVSQVIADLRRSLGERYLLIVSNIYFRGLFRKRSAHELGNFIKFHSKTLRDLGGEGYSKLLEYGMAQKHIIKSPAEARVGERTNAYRLDQSTLLLKTQQRYELTTIAAIKARPKPTLLLKTGYMKKGPVYRKIVESYDGMSFDYAAAIAFVSKLPTSNPPEVKAMMHRQRFIEGLIYGLEHWSVDRQGRNYTLLVLCPRNLRRFFTHRQGTLYSLDIKSSQPLLHALLYEGSPAEEKTYRSIVEGGTFWEFINGAAGSPYDVSDEDQKAQLKERLFQEVFYRGKEPKKGVTKLFAVTFKNTFPTLWGLMDGVKTQTRRGSSRISRSMQEIEADVVKEAMVPLVGRPYPLITIHDCIVTTKTGIADVRASLMSAFAQLNLNPTLSEKQL